MAAMPAAQENGLPRQCEHWLVMTSPEDLHPAGRQNEGISTGRQYKRTPAIRRGFSE